MARNLPAMVVNEQGEVWTQQGKVGMADSKQFLNSLGSEQSITTLQLYLQLSNKNFMKSQSLIMLQLKQEQVTHSQLVLFNWTTGIKGGILKQSLMNMASK